MRLLRPLADLPQAGTTPPGGRAATAPVTAPRRYAPPSALELVLLATVIGVLIAVALPGYLRLVGGSSDAPPARLVQATRALERHHAASGTYEGAVVPAGVRLRSASRSSFCVETEAGRRAWHASADGKPARGGCVP